MDRALALAEPGQAPPEVPDRLREPEGVVHRVHVRHELLVGPRARSPRTVEREHGHQHVDAELVVQAPEAEELDVGTSTHALTVDADEPRPRAVVVPEHRRVHVAVRVERLPPVTTGLVDAGLPPALEAQQLEGSAALLHRTRW